MLSKNKISIIKKMCILFIILIICISFDVSCKNPKEFEPPFDSLSPPPPAPQLISPRNDTAIYYQTPYPHDIKLKWGVVEDVEYYQLQIANDTTTLPLAPLVNVEVCSTAYEISRNGFYFWRVRAYNRKWTWYTDWSQTWHFGAFYAP